MWKIKNTGNVDWPVGCHLLFNGGSILRPYPMSRPDCFAVPVISPDEETCITAELQAPDCPGEYTSYFCLCSPDGDRFGDNLWCSIKVDQDLEPEKTKQVSAASSVINSPTNMIYPTVFTASSMNNINDQQQQQQQQQQEEQIENPFETDYYSESTTGDHESTTCTYTNSQVSSPSPSELDIGEGIDSTFCTSDEQSHHSDQIQNNEDGDLSSYQVTSPAASIIHEELLSNAEEEDDDFVIVSEDEQDMSIEHKSVYSDDSSSMHSTQTVTENVLQNSANIYQSQLLQLHEMVQE
jgi:hypothetical protein